MGESEVNSTMKECSFFSDTVCSICFDDLKPIVQHLQVISICGHVFHETCVQNWFDHCSKVQKIFCPICKQSCSEEDVCRLYIQSIDHPNLSQKQFGVEVEDDPKELHKELKRLKRRISVLVSSFEHQERGLYEELCIYKLKAKKEEGLKNEAMQQKDLFQHLLYSKLEGDEEIDKKKLIQALESDNKRFNQTMANNTNGHKQSKRYVNVRWENVELGGAIATLKDYTKNVRDEVIKFLQQVRTHRRENQQGES
ncbi:hypothetical protein NE237_025722 [Protea cynaroides]|uniref:RING-type domain-containing protein n=1 Tax=Protea cynaroides TaxID=273540 RepID=A0A9Q0H2G8_9MAGN|nr:hypothetical protein NE237_025722 [Protea cynaroides]